MKNANLHTKSTEAAHLHVIPRCPGGGRL